MESFTTVSLKRMVIMDSGSETIIWVKETKSNDDDGDCPFPGYK